MKKKIDNHFRQIMCSLLLMTLVFISKAQKEERATGITQEQINMVNEIVKPVKIQVDNILKEDGSGLYKAYQDEIRKLTGIKSNKERAMYSKQILEKYAAFFKEVWTRAKIDEPLYQQRIRKVFTEASGIVIEFQPFLGFSMEETTSTPPPPAPLPEDKCLDVCTILGGDISGSSGLIAGGAGDYGNCFLRTSSWGVAVGGNNLYGSLRNNISIPGTLPNDARKLHVRKSYEIKLEATSFAVLGFGLAETSVSSFQNYNHILVMSPVIFGASKILRKTVNEDYILEKVDVAKSKITSSSNTFAYFITGNWCNAECYSVRWTICEEK